MTAPALTRHRLLRFMRDHQCDFVRNATSNHQLWRDRKSGKTVTVGPRVTNADAIVRTLNRMRRENP